MSNDRLSKVGEFVASGEVEVNQGCGRWNEISRLAYRPKEVSEALGISLPLVYGMIRNGQLRALKINNSYILPVSTLMNNLDALAGKEIQV